MSIQYKCIVSAPYETRNVWSLASKAVIDASASHAMTSVDEKTPPRIGVVLTRATVQDFQSLGVLVQKVTEIFGTIQPHFMPLQRKTSHLWKVMALATKMQI
jgi:hypothetical protein